MPRFYKRKEGAKARKKIDAEKIKLAVIEGLKEESKILTVAKKFDVDRMTLKRYMKKYEDNPNHPMTSNYQKKIIFTAEREAELAEYLKTCAKMNSGLTYRKVREFAYELAVENTIEVPKTWHKNRLAGIDWLKGFMKRSPSLSLRTPEATSMSRATSFNKKNVSDFFTNLQIILEREHLTEHNIWNVDETGYTTVQKPKKVIAPKGQKQVGQLTSGERVQLVTICCAISAAGTTIPPFFVFPRVNFKPMMLIGAPSNSAGAANTSGWMTADIFHLYLKHFAVRVKCSPDNKVLLILDNHESHISNKSLNFAKENSIILLTLPPHCSHRLQPLDVSVYYSFKNACDKASNEWMAEHPGMVINIYDLSYIIVKAFPIAMKSTNIISGFKKTGIFPLNPHIFTDDDFLPSAVTDRPEPLPESIIESEENAVHPLGSVLDASNIAEDEAESLQEDICTTSKGQEPGKPVARTSGISVPKKDFVEAVACSSGTASTSSVNFIVTLAQLLPFPKAGLRKQTRKGRKKLKSAILTDTPIKTDLENELKLREERKVKKCENAEKRTLARLTKEKKVEIVKKKVFTSSSSSSSGLSEDVSYAKSGDSWNIS